MNGDFSIYQTLLESTQAIPWIIDWKSKQFTYIGPQIFDLLGWPRSSWATVDDWISKIHGNDRDAVASFCVKQTESGIDHEAEYRALTPSGGYVWVRDVVHVIRKNDVVDSLAGFIIPISDRNKDGRGIFPECGTLPTHTPSGTTPYGFTDAETRLAIALVSGKKASDYAKDKGISINTVRSQIRSLLEKAGVNRQTDLVRTLINSEILSRPISALSISKSRDRPQ